MTILKKPLVTEKFTAISEKLNKVSFIVAKAATNSVNVTNVNTMIYAGKSKARFTKRGHFSGSKPSFKKAVITLQEGQKIDFFQNI
jgi:large subunit ribosomal protein L23